MRRGQAAMEFLMTYGWAIMVLLVMIAALAYFGVLNPQRFLPDKCLLSTGFECRDFIVRQNGGALQLQITLGNKMGSNVIINYLNVSTSRGSTTSSINCAASPVTIEADQTSAFTCLITGSTSPGLNQPAKIDILMINYTTATGVYSHVATGTIQSTVQS
jgi:hypothetical protein